jgi:hypothetical protein
MSRLVVIGSGRSGTGYMAELFRAVGLVSSHEQVFTCEAVLGIDPLDWGDYEVASSWMAVPYLEAHPDPDLQIVHVVRDPLSVAASFVSLEFFARDHPNDEYEQIIRRAAPAVYHEGTEEDRALAFWFEWVGRCEALASETICLDKVTGPKIARLAALVRPGRYPANASWVAVDDTPRDVNHKVTIRPLDVDAADPWLLAAVEERWKRIHG